MAKSVKTKQIMVEEVTSEKGNKVFKVYVIGSTDKKNEAYCKTALSTLRFIYMLMAKGNLEISSLFMDYLRLLNKQDKEKLQKKETTTEAA